MLEKMEAKEKETLWSRHCPQCGSTVEHKSKAKCRAAEKAGSPCVKCSRSNNGKKNAGTEKCSLCTEEFRTSKEGVEEHAARHGVSPEELWLRLKDASPALCKCGCGRQTTWVGWAKGYSSVLCGHNASIYSVYEEEKALEIAAKRSAALRGTTGWSKGLTKETDERVAARAAATSVGRKKAFDEGELKAWSKGLTKETDERLLAFSQRLKEDFANGIRSQWHKGLSEEVDDRVKQKNESLRQAYESGRVKAWHAGKTAAEDPRIDKFWANRDAMKEYQHVHWSEDVVREKLSGNQAVELVEIESYKNVYVSSILVRCKSCGWSDAVTFDRARADRCPKCTPIGSRGQNEIADWLQSLGLYVGRNVVGILDGKKQLDIFVPEKMVAIEFNGLFWHGETQPGKDARYHQQKSLSCEKHGVSLVHIFEDEWYDKREVVKSTILSKLQMINDRVNARDCDVVGLSPEERREFFELNHLDGDVNASFSFGLRTKDGELVAAISARRPFHKKYSESLEIARFCSRVNLVVPGGMSRLVKKVVQEARVTGVSSVISYVDTRLGGDGNGYVLSGFILEKKTSPRYWWTDYHKRFDRFKFKADPSRGMTEAQVADEAGVVKIWGCSNLVYRLNVSPAANQPAVGVHPPVPKEGPLSLGLSDLPGVDVND